MMKLKVLWSIGNVWVTQFTLDHTLVRSDATPSGVDGAACSYAVDKGGKVVHVLFIPAVAEYFATAGLLV